MKRFKIIVPILAAVCVIIYGAYRVINLAEVSQNNIPVLYDVPNFSFASTGGGNFTQDSLLGKLSVVDFIFTHCKGACPMMTGKMSYLYTQYSSVPDVQFVSVSIDPKNDSLSVLRKYASGFGVNDNRWKFLRGDSASTGKLYEEGFKLSGELPYNHSLKFTLVDRKGKIRGYFNSDDDVSLKVLKTQINTLLNQ